MILNALLLVLQLPTTPAPVDTVRRVADTLFIEPAGIRFTVPWLWMGGLGTSAKLHPPGKDERPVCQILAARSLNERIVTDPSLLASLDQGVFGERRTSQDALDSVVPRTAMVVHAGGDRFNGSCIAPQVHVYLVDGAQNNATGFGVVAQRVVDHQYAGVRRSEADSAGWHVVRMAWQERKTDFIHPATLDIWSRPVSGRLLIFGVMDRWAAFGDTDSLLASVREIAGPGGQEFFAPDQIPDVPRPTVQRKRKVLSVALGTLLGGTGGYFLARGLRNEFANDRNSSQGPVVVMSVAGAALGALIGLAIGRH